MKKEKWLIYTRVSTQAQSEKYGLDAQVSILTKLAKDRNYSYELLNEGAVSGETIYERPKMIELLNKVKTGAYKGCLLIELERLSRSERLGDWDTIKEAFVQGNAKIATPGSTLDPANIEDDFILDIGGVLSKREKRIILKRMMRGKAEKLKQGKSIGGTSIPFGYQANKETDDIEISPEEKKVYDTMAGWALKGEGIYTIAKNLNKVGIPTRYGRKGWKLKKKTVSNLWRASTVYKILKQEYYTGLKPLTFHFKKYHTEDVDLYLPALISPDKFWQLQNKLTGVENTFRKRGNSYFFLLKGLLRCGLCGRTMYGHGSPKKRKSGRSYVYKFYRCENRNPPPRGTNCRMESVSQAVIDQAVRSDLLDVVQNSGRLAAMLKETSEKSDTSLEPLRAKYEDLSKSISSKDEEEKRIVKAYRQGIISIEELEEQKRQILKEKTELTREAGKADTEIKAFLFQQGRQKSLQDYVKETWGKVQDFTPEEFFEFCHNCLDSVILGYNRKTKEHSIDINFAIPVLSAQHATLKKGGFGNFSSGDDEDSQCAWADPIRQGPHRHTAFSEPPPYCL